MITFDSGGSAFDVQAGVLMITGGTASLAYSPTLVHAATMPEPGFHPPDFTAIDVVMAPFIAILCCYVAARVWISLPLQRVFPVR